MRKERIVVQFNSAGETEIEERSHEDQREMWWLQSRMSLGCKAYVSIVYVYSICVCVFPFPLVSLCVCLSKTEPMDGSHSFWPECGG